MVAWTEEQISYEWVWLCMYLHTQKIYLQTQIYMSSAPNLTTQILMFLHPKNVSCQSLLLADNHCMHKMKKCEKSEQKI